MDCDHVVAFQQVEKDALRALGCEVQGNNRTPGCTVGMMVDAKAAFHAQLADCCTEATCAAEHFHKDQALDGASCNISRSGCQHESRHLAGTSGHMAEKLVAKMHRLLRGRILSMLFLAESRISGSFSRHQ